MSIVVKPNTFSSGAVIVASEHNSNFDTIYDDYNGNITNANISATAAIAGSKLDLSSISTATPFSIALIPDIPGSKLITLNTTSTATQFPLGTLPLIPGSQLTLLAGTTTATQFPVNSLPSIPGSKLTTLAGTPTSDQFPIQALPSIPGSKLITLAGTPTSDQFPIQALPSIPGSKLITLAGTPTSDQFPIQALPSIPGSKLITLATIGTGAGIIPTYNKIDQIITATFAAVTSFNLLLSNKHQVTLTGGTTLALVNVTTSQAFAIKLIAGNTAANVITWWDTIKWAGGSAPSTTTGTAALNKADWFGFIATAPTGFDGFVIGQNV